MELLGALLKSLGLTVENILGAAAEQTVLFEKAARYRILKMHDRVQAESQYDECKAAVALGRRKHFQQIGEKLTEAHLTETLLVDKRLKPFKQRLFLTEQEEEYSKLLLEAYRHRRDALQVIAQVAGRDISMERAMETATAKLSDARNKLRAKYPDQEV